MASTSPPAMGPGRRRLLVTRLPGLGSPFSNRSWFLASRLEPEVYGREATIVNDRIELRSLRDPRSSRRGLLGRFADDSSAPRLEPEVHLRAGGIEMTSDGQRRWGLSP